MTTFSYNHYFKPLLIAPSFDSLLTRGHPLYQSQNINFPAGIVLWTDFIQPHPSSNPVSRTFLQQRDSMSQSPFYAARDEHASESWGANSCNTSQERSMEPSIEVPGLSDGNKGSHFPFMKLPIGKSTVAYTVCEERELTFIFTPHRDPAGNLPIPPDRGPILVQGCGAHRKTLERSRA